MEVMLLKNKKIGEKGEIKKGEKLPVRPMQCSNLIGNIVNYFQIIDINSPFSGELIKAEDCIEIIKLSKEKTYTEKQWNDMDNYRMTLLDKEREQKERARQLVSELTESMKKKNAEINSLEYCVNVQAGSLHAMTEAFHKLKALEKFQKN